jgi:hypothetical protein
MPPLVADKPDPKAREELESQVTIGDGVLKRYRAAVRGKDATLASQLLADLTARYRGVVTALSTAADIPELRQLAWFGLGRASVLAGALLEADERLRLAATASQQANVRVLRHRALTLFRLAKKSSEMAVQPVACLAESCRLFAVSEKLPSALTPRWLHRWARAVDMGCAANAPDSYTSREAWYRAFRVAAEKPNGNSGRRSPPLLFANAQFSVTQPETADRLRGSQ